MVIDGKVIKEGTVKHVQFIKEWEGWETFYVYHYTLTTGEILNVFTKIKEVIHKPGDVIYYSEDGIKDGIIKADLYKPSRINKHKEMEHENNNPQAKVISIKGNGDWTGSHGTFYSFEVELEGVGIISVNHKTLEPPYSIGEMVEYEITATTQKFGTKGKIKKATDNPYTPTKSQQPKHQPKSDDVQNMIVRQSALKAAVEVATKGDEDFSPIQITGLAEYFFNYCISGNVIVYLPAPDGEAYTNDQVQEMMHEAEMRMGAVNESEDLPF